VRGILRPEVTIGIPAFNEEKNIQHVLEKILQQSLPFSFEVIVVSDGSTDSTAQIVQEVSKIDPSVRLICHRNRMGRTEALNTIFRELQGESLVIVSADTVLHDNSIGHIVAPLADPSVGMCWSKLIPVYVSQNLASGLAGLAFQLHDRLSGKLDATGELVHVTGDVVSMKRELCAQIPGRCVNADEYLSVLTVRMGLRVKYIRSVLYRAALPTTISDHVRQRRRWLYGHLQIGRMLGEYPTVLEFVSFRKPLLPFCIIAEELLERPRGIPYFLALLFLELVAGALALQDILLKREHYSWKVIESTKRRPIGITS